MIQRPGRQLYVDHTDADPSHNGMGLIGDVTLSKSQKIASSEIFVQKAV